jgi:catechol 2,3-dioxygenase-like lactoylglutathione lyase family enzyme
MRGVVGIAPDPLMYVAINCQDVKESKEFYEQLGFFEQEVPYSRPSKGTTMFDPAPPKNSYYMAPSPNCMGVLLLQGKKKKSIVPNPVIESLNIVYKPSSEETSGDAMFLKDPSGVPIRFQSADAFTKLEKITH